MNSHIETGRTESPVSWQVDLKWGQEASSPEHSILLHHALASVYAASRATAVGRHRDGVGPPPLNLRCATSPKLARRPERPTPHRNAPKSVRRPSRTSGRWPLDPARPP